MARFILWPAAVAMIAFLSGCADFTKQAYKPSHTEPIRKVLIATQTDFPKASFGIDPKMAMMGLIGTTMSLSTADGKTQTLDQVLAGQGAQYHEQLLAELTSALQAGGISAQTIAVRRNEDGGLAEDYQSMASGRSVDAILNIRVLQAGYGDAHAARDPGVRPILLLRARLISAKTFEMLYADAISYGYGGSLLDAREIRASEKYYFRDTQMVIIEKEKSAEGLRAAATEVAHFLAAQFTRQHSASNR